MKLKLNSIFFVLVLVLSISVHGQNPYYSQYFMAPTSLNPALIGKGVDDMRFMGNQKQQWWGASSAAFTVSSFSFEKRIYEKIPNLNELAISILLFSDASNNNILKNNFIVFGGAYNIKTSSKSKFGTGIQFSYGNRLLDVNQFSFQSQFGSLGFQRNLPSYDPIQIPSARFLNANAGINYSYDEKNWGYTLGISVFNAAVYKNGVYNTSSSVVLPRYSFQGSIYKKLQQSDELRFLGLFDTQGANKVYTLGALYKYALTGKHPITDVNVGFFKRFGDAVIPYLGIEAKSWMLGFSYDVISSDVKSYYNSVQSIEVSFAKKLVSKKRVKYVDTQNQKMIHF